jgi:hypothetical protein
MGCTKGSRCSLNGWWIGKEAVEAELMTLIVKND